MCQKQVNKLLDEIRLQVKGNQSIPKTIDGIVSGFNAIARSECWPSSTDYILASRVISLLYLRETLQLDGISAKALDRLAEENANQIHGYLRGPIYDLMGKDGSKSNKQSVK